MELRMPSEVRVDDGFFDTPAARRAGKDGRALHVAATCWSSANGTDGQIPGCVIPLLAAKAEVSVRVPSHLVTAGLWTETGDGYALAPYLADNPTAAAVDARQRRLSRDRSEAGVRGASARWQNDGKGIAKEEEVTSSSSVAGGGVQGGRADELLLPFGSTEVSSSFDDRVGAAIDLEVEWRLNERTGRPVVNAERWRAEVRRKVADEPIAVLLGAEAATDPAASPMELWQRARPDSADPLDALGVLA